MKVEWSFFSRRRNTSLKTWIQEFKLTTVEDVQESMNARNIEPPHPDEIQIALASIVSPKPKVPAKKVAKPAPAKKTTRTRKTTATKRKTVKK